MICHIITTLFRSIYRDDILNTDLDEHLVLCHNITREADKVSSVLAEVNPLLNDEHLCDTMSSASKLGKYMMSIGFTHINNAKYLVENDHTPNSYVAPMNNHPVGDQVGLRFDDVSNKDIYKTQDICNMQSYLDLLDPHSNDAYDKLMMNDIDLGDIMVSAFHGGHHEGMKLSELAKIWRIDADTS